MMVTDTLLVLDNLYNRATVIANVEVRAGRGRRRAAPALSRRPTARIDDWVARLAAPGHDPAAGARAARRAAARRLALRRRPVPGRRAPDQGVHRRGRHLPDRALAPARGGRARSVPHLPLPARAQSRAVPVLPPLRRHPRHRQLARDPGAGGGRRGHAAADRRHAPARRHAGGGRGARRRARGRSQGAGRAPHAGGPRPERRRPGGGVRLGAAHRLHDHRALLARDAPGERGPRPAPRPSSTPWRRSPRPFRPAPCPARPRCAPCRSSTSWSRSAAGPTPARSATSAGAPAPWTPPSPSAPASCAAAAPGFRPAPASWPTPIPPPNGGRPRPRRGRCCWRWRCARRAASARGRLSPRDRRPPVRFRPIFHACLHSPRQHRRRPDLRARRGPDAGRRPRDSPATSPSTIRRSPAATPS